MELISLSHGSGGRLTRELIKEILLRELGNEFLEPLTDSAILQVPGSRLAFTTDSYVVDPIFFPGGDIGKLSVFGTVNDISVMGARPLYISLGLIIEEGFPVDDLKRIVHSIRVSSKEAGVKVVTGDTKVVEKGKGDGIFINTSGIGVLLDGVDLSPARIEKGDLIMVSGTVGDHGASIMAKREGLGFHVEIESDCSPLNHLIEEILPLGGVIKFMRDPTRGGLVAVLNEMAEEGAEVEVEEDRIPVREEVGGLCEILGIDPLYLACEGRVVIVSSGEGAEEILKRLKSHPHGRDASIIGEVTGKGNGGVVLKTHYGTKRILQLPAEFNLPRIC